MGVRVHYQDLIGLPFKYGGRSLEQGHLDCYGVVTVLSARIGVQLPERQWTERCDLNHALMAQQMSQWRRLPGPRPGAIVLIRIKSPGGLASRYSHVGFVINEFEFVHAWEGSGGVVCERLSTWERRIEGFYEYAG